MKFSKIMLRVSQNTKVLNRNVAVDRDGFSLVEVLIACGIMGIMSLAIISGIDNSRRAVKSLEIKLELIDFSTAFKNQIASNAACTSAFSAARILPSQLIAGSSISIPSSEINFQGNLLSNRNFQNFESSEVSFVVNDVPVPGSANGVLRFNLIPKSQNSSLMKNKDVTTAFSISVSATGVITSCPGAAPIGAFGIGQTYNDLTTSRVFGAMYTNSTTNPSLVVISMNCKAESSGTTVSAGFFVDGLQIGQWRARPESSSGDWSGAYTSSFVIPPGSTYQATHSTGHPNGDGCNFLRWVEFF